MQNISTISLRLDDWQQAALLELARSRGVDVEAMAQSLLNERLVERLHTAFDDLMAEEPSLRGADLLGTNIPRHGIGHAAFLPTSDCIEHRLRRLFDE